MNDENLVFFEIFPWTANFETGIELIDEQHKVLVDILNQLAAHLANRSDEIKLHKIFDELADYADYHFKSEEKIWSEYFSEDEWFINHEHTHGSFIDEVIAIKSNIDEKPMDEVVYEVVTFLSKWLAYHILDTDKRMAIVVKNIQSGYSLAEAKEDASEQMSGFMKVIIETVLTMYESLSTRTLDLMREKSLRLQAQEALSRSEERWKFIVEGGSDNVWDWDFQENVLVQSQEDPILFKIISGRMQGSGHEAKIHPSDAIKMQSALQSHLEEKTDFFTSKHRVLQPNGGWSWILTRGKVVSRDDEGKPLRMVGTHTDITERELASLIHKNSTQAIFICDSNCNIVNINPAFTKITGYSEEEAIGKNPRFMASGEHSKEFYTKMWESICTQGDWSGKIVNKRKSGELFEQYIDIQVVGDSQDEVDHYVGMFNDITEEEKYKKLENEQKDILAYQVHHDPLTKLPNRVLFNEKLIQTIEKNKRHHHLFALLFVDLDHFKHINDSLGHAVGDKVLQEISHRLQKHIRKDDTLARFGGDEFVLLVEDLVHPQDAAQMAQKILQCLAQAIIIEGHKFYLSSSIGISIFPQDAHDVQTLLMHADAAMYRAKEVGRNNFQFYSAEMTASAFERVALESSLRQALELEEFVVYYQPQINGKSGQLTGMEALVRWNHPTLGLVPPIKFIGLAEETGLIVPLDAWVMKTAMKQIQTWYSQGLNPGILAINLSMKQLHQKDFMAQFNNICLDANFQSQWLELEVTESQIMTKPEEAIAVLQQISDMGIKLAIDDFGTGYSSLSYLKRLPINKLKIDKSFVDGLPDEEEDASIAKAVIALANSLKLDVIAEGVETAQQRDFLIQNGCDHIQGYLYGKPMPSDELKQKFLVPTAKEEKK